MGSEFHAWVEHHFGAPALMYPDEAEESGEAAASGDLDLAHLRARFLASPWAARTPIAVEVDLLRRRSQDT